MGDFIVIVILSIIVILIIRSMRNERINHKGCNGSCSGCHKNCHESRRTDNVQQPSINLRLK